jgi:hypothetical protein
MKNLATESTQQLTSPSTTPTRPRTGPSIGNEAVRPPAATQARAVPEETPHAVMPQPYRTDLMGRSDRGGFDVVGRSSRSGFDLMGLPHLGALDAMGPSGHGGLDVRGLSGLGSFDVMGHKN